MSKGHNFNFIKIMQVLKFSLGVDMSKDKFDCCLSYCDKGEIIIVAEKSFDNSLKGFKALLSWLKSKTGKSQTLHVVMEATGVYHESLAHYIFDNSQYPISILLPIKVKYYFKSMNVKSKTDKIDAVLLSRYGLERRSLRWSPMSRNIRAVKQLSREYRDLKKQLNVLKNKLHAKEHAYRTERTVLKIIKQQIKLIENQCILLEFELKEIVLNDTFLNEKMDKICTIPGVGFMTAITIVGETNGFELIENGKQLCSYAGMDVRQNMSGNKTGKSRLSKRGNKYIRQAIYMPALTSSRRIKSLNNFYERINEKNKCKKVGLLAVARKLLILIYTLWKNDEEFIPEYGM